MQGQGFWKSEAISVSSMAEATRQFQQRECNPNTRFSIQAQPADWSFLINHDESDSTRREFTYLQLAMYWGDPEAVVLACQQNDIAQYAEQLPALCDDLQRSVATTQAKLTIVGTLQNIPAFNAVVINESSLLAILRAQLQAALDIEQRQAASFTL